MTHPLGVNNNASPLGVPADLQSADKKGSTYSIADLQSASSEFALLAPVLLADFKSAIVTHTAADCKSAETVITAPDIARKSSSRIHWQAHRHAP